MRLTGQNKTGRTLLGLTIIFLTIEVVDELVGGVLGAAWPLIRQDLHLSYVQVGMVLTLPRTVSRTIQPLLGLWGDLGQRRSLILGGGIGFGCALLLLSLSQDFAWFLLGFVLLDPAAGSFVNLSQATLMDLEPTRHENNMARWALAGSVGNVVGPLLLAGAIALQQSWRGAFFLLAVLTGLLLVRLWPALLTIATTVQAEVPQTSFKEVLRNAIAALKRGTVLRWLTLLQFSDLMLDVLRGFVALYIVDVVGGSTTQAGLALAVWLGFGLLGDILLLPLLERARGVAYLRVSASLVLCLYPAFLIVPDLTSKFILLGCLGLLNAGWYSILKGQLYTAMPGQSGTVMTLSNVFSLVGSLAPLLLSFVAQQWGLQSAMWVLLAAPIALLLGLLR